MLMSSLIALPVSKSGEFRCRTPINLFDSPTCETLATQAVNGRHLKILADTSTEKAIQVRLCEDGYCAWLLLANLTELEPAATAYQSISLFRRDIEPRLGGAIAYMLAALKQPNYYLWGGTVGPNYDCSGLMQAAFASFGIWLPRDSQQQELFVKKLEKNQLLPGDLIFFGTDKVNHVALYFGEGNYIHSSGREMGRNGIAIDRLSNDGDEVSRHYFHQFWSGGRIMKNYCPD